MLAARSKMKKKTKKKRKTAKIKTEKNQTKRSAASDFFWFSFRVFSIFSLDLNLYLIVLPT